MLLFTLLLLAQEPIKNNNVIIVKGIVFSKVKEILLDSGFFIDQQNAEDGSFVTQRKGFCECPNKDFYQLIYYIRVKDSVAIIGGKWNAIVSQRDNNVTTSWKENIRKIKIAFPIIYSES